MKINHRGAGISSSEPEISRDHRKHSNIQKKATGRLGEDVQAEGMLVVWGLFLREKNPKPKKGGGC